MPDEGVDILSTLHFHTELTNKSTLQTKGSYSQEEKLIHLLQALRYPFFNHKKKWKKILHRHIFTNWKQKSGAGKMAQRVKVLATKPVSLIQSLEHISQKQRTNSHKLSWHHVHTTPCIHPHTHTYKIRKCNKFHFLDSNRIKQNIKEKFSIMFNYVKSQISSKIESIIN